MPGDQFGAGAISGGFGATATGNSATSGGFAGSVPYGSQAQQASAARGFSTGGLAPYGTQAQQSGIASGLSTAVPYGSQAYQAAQQQTTGGATAGLNAGAGIAPLPGGTSQFAPTMPSGALIPRHTPGSRIGGPTAVLPSAAFGAANGAGFNGTGGALRSSPFAPTQPSGAIAPQSNTAPSPTNPSPVVPTGSLPAGSSGLGSTTTGVNPLVGSPAAAAISRAAGIGSTTAGTTTTGRGLFRGSGNMFQGSGGTNTFKGSTTAPAASPGGIQ